MEQWLLEQRQDDIVDTLKVLTAGIASAGNTRCIKCGDTMDVCAYCYTNDVLHLVKHDPLLLEQYLMYFNYDLEHMGWEQEARAYLEGC